MFARSGQTQQERIRTRSESRYIRLGFSRLLGRLLRGADVRCPLAGWYLSVTEPQPSAKESCTLTRRFWHGKSIFLAIGLELGGQAITQFGSQSVELLSLRRVIKRQWTGFHRLIGFLVSSKRSDSSSSSEVPGGHEHCDALAVPLTSLVEPFLDPPQQQRISTLLAHGDREIISLYGRNEVQSFRQRRTRRVLPLWEHHSHVHR